MTNIVTSDAFSGQVYFWTCCSDAFRDVSNACQCLPGYAEVNGKCLCADPLADQTTSCTSCINNIQIGKNRAGICSSCPTHCNICSDSDTCTSCNQGYGLDSNHLCTVSCPSNCNTCGPTGVCSSCIIGFGIIP
jgi:hypothetical protein